MTFVEHTKYPPLLWGTNIQVERKGDNLLLSAAEIFSEEQQRAGHDVFGAYRSAISRFGGAKRHGKNAPHIQFANAITDHRLIEFSKGFGPVLVSSLRYEERTVCPDPYDIEPTEIVMFAQQDLVELRNEQQLYRAAVALVAELERSAHPNIDTVRESISTIAEKVSSWPGQWRREQQLRSDGAVGGSRPPWHFGEDELSRLVACQVRATGEKSREMRAAELFGWADPIGQGHLVICELVNAYPSVVYPWGRTSIEGPNLDLSCGIRPLLYYILKLEHLQSSGIAVCGNKDCRELFEIERASQRFCSEQCSRLQRQRDYWATHGKRLREKRRKRDGAVRKAARKGK